MINALRVYLFIFPLGLQVSGNLTHNFPDILSGIKILFFNDENELNKMYAALQTEIYQPALVPEDAYLNIKQLVTKYGYILEEHKVVTKDGYILTLHRIPQSRDGTKNGLLVFLMHGIMDSSDGWIISGPDEALGYMLADYGFDVWMGNARGNKYARSHTHLNPEQSNFWHFTFEEIGLYDVTSMIDYALNLTKKKSLYYIGHSQGTTVFYVMTSMRPEYNKKVKMQFSLAPVAFVSHTWNPAFKMFSPKNKIFTHLISQIKYLPRTDIINKVTSELCSTLPVTCNYFVSVMEGTQNKFINESLVPVIFGHTPISSSVYQFLHFGQLIDSTRFCRYDFGRESNLNRYGQTAPPDYNLSKVTVPVSLYVGSKDWSATQEDSIVLTSHLKNVESHLIDDFTHMDFLYASVAKIRIYSKIITDIFDYENRTEY